MDDLRVPLFQETSIYIYVYIPISRTIQTISGDIQKIASWIWYIHGFILHINLSMQKMNVFFKTMVSFLYLLTNELPAFQCPMCPVPALRSHATVLQMASAISPPAEMGASLHRSTAWADWTTEALGVASWWQWGLRSWVKEQRLYDKIIGRSVYST